MIRSVDVPRMDLEEGEKDVRATASGARWSVEQRLAFIGRRLAWDRRINRADLVARFGISPNQATADLARFAALNPGALLYDGRVKTYRAAEGWARPDAEDAATLLRELRLIAEGVLGPAEGVLATPPELALAEAPLRGAAPAILSRVIDAIRQGLVLEAVYQSFSSPEPKLRRLEPHALVFDGYRWHARARDADTDLFKDFVLGRLSNAALAGPAAGDPARDVAWRRRVRLEIGPNPALAPHQQAAVAADYGMSEGRLVLTPRAAMVYYVKLRLGLLADAGARRPEDQHIVVVSED